MTMPSRLLFDRNTTDGTADSCCAHGNIGDSVIENSDESFAHLRSVDALDRDALGGNASIPYAAVEAGGPPARPLEFPAPIVDRAWTVAADILDHRTGNLFRATSVLMRRPIHAKACPSRASPVHNYSGGGASFDSNATRSRGHYRNRSADSNSIHSWHCAFNAPSSSLNPDSPGADNRKKRLPHPQSRLREQHQQQQQQQQQRPRVPCGAECDLPDRAYCVRKKLCNTTYGSVRLCVVLKRVGRHVLDYASRIHPNNGWDSSDGRGTRVEATVPAWETTDEMVVIKVTNWARLQSLRGRHLEDPVKEMAALQQLLGNYHPNVVSMLDALQDEAHLFCVFPYIAGGDLYGCLLDRMTVSPTGRIEESQARTWFRQILCALSHLQKKGVCHRDLCLENMMVDDEDNVRLIDFGLCLRVPFSDPNTNGRTLSDVSANTPRRLMKAQGQCGYWEYMSPEVCLRSESFDGFAIDLWAAGIVLFEFLVGKKPFSMPDPVDQNFHTIAVEGKLAELLQSKGIEVNDRAVDLLQKMLHFDPAERLTLAEIVDHPWVRGNGGKRAAPSARDEGMENRWFIKTESIDDMDGGGAVDPADLLPVGVLSDSYSRSFTVESMASTADTSDAESQRLSPSFDCPDHEDASFPQKEPLDSLEEDGTDATNEMEARKKRGWFGLKLKPTKWRCAGKSTSLALQTSGELS